MDWLSKLTKLSAASPQPHTAGPTEGAAGRFATLAVHAGVEDGAHGEIMTGIAVSTTFRQSSPGVPVGEFDYSRAGNPTRQAFERAIASLEGGQYGFAFSSGMAAMATLVALLRSGDRVLAMNDLYGGSDRLLSKVAVPNWGLCLSQLDMANVGAVGEAVETTRPRMVWIESPTNPTLRLVDIAAVARAVRAVDPTVTIVVDNTFASPYLQQPLRLGADVVLHSVTKYIGGHSDVLMGAVVVDNEHLAERIGYLQLSMGAVPSPFDCFLALRGLKTLHLRMQRQSDSALRIADFLAKHPRIETVFYPGLPGSPQHDLCVRQMPRGAGGVVSFRLAGADLQTAVRFCRGCRIIALAESLGGVESLIDLPAVMTHAGVAVEKRTALGITDTLLRLSVGVEDVEDLIGDLTEALKEAYEPV